MIRFILFILLTPYANSKEILDNNYIICETLTRPYVITIKENNIRFDFNKNIIESYIINNFIEGNNIKKTTQVGIEKYTVEIDKESLKGFLKIKSNNEILYPIECKYIDNLANKKTQSPKRVPATNKSSAKFKF